MLSDVEFVTPEGRFASIRTPTVIDAFGAGWYASDNKLEALLKLCVYCVKLDGEKITSEQFGNLPMYEADAIVAKVVELMKAPPKGKA